MGKMVPWAILYLLLLFGTIFNGKNGMMFFFCWPLRTPKADTARGRKGRDDERDDRSTVQRDARLGLVGWGMFGSST